jgi:assimilatory nitrate reductase catalytic subunit
MATRQKSSAGSTAATESLDGSLAEYSTKGRIPSWLRQWNGPLTQELLQHPAQFGLGQLPVMQQPDTTTAMVCGYCSTGCGLNIHLREGVAIGISPAADYPVNLGMACPKGWEALTVLRASDRATAPLIRERGSDFRELSWDHALKIFCDQFKSIRRQYGAHSLAFISTGQIVTEEMALLGCLAKFGMGILHGDSNTRQCMATSAAAYKESFGFDAPPYTYADFEESDVIVLVGSNLCIAHPIQWQRILRNKRNPKIVVLDPRRTETAQAASLHLALRPKSDLILLYGLANLLIENDWIDHSFIRDSTKSFDGFRDHVAAFHPARVAQETGIGESTLHTLAKWIHEGPRTSFWWTMGVNQSYEGVRTAQAIINLALMTGNIGKPGTGPNSITGQCNAMGSRLFSNTTNLIGGHDFQSLTDREKVAGILGIDVDRIPTEKSWAYDQILDGIRQDRIKGLWIIATNTAHSWMDQHDVRETLKKLDFLVVQDMYHTTETAQLADMILPAAAWGEKDGTFINSERRIGLTKKIARAPGQALADFSIFKLVAEYWGCGEMFERWTTPEGVFQIMKKLSRSQPCDITGIDNYRMIDDAGGVQWPFPERDVLDSELDQTESTDRCKAMSAESRLFSDGRFYHPDHKARFIYAIPGEMPEPPCEEFPLLLLTGRGTVSQWHTQTRTSKSAQLRKLYPPAVYIELHPSDAAKLKIAPMEKVVVRSRRGQLTATAFVTATIQAGQAFLPMHYEVTNRLTLFHIDPISRQPSYKDCAVRVEKCEIE